MRSDLNQQPQPEGTTSYCNKSFHLVNNGPKSSQQIDQILKNLNKTGPMLGTKSYGKRKSRKRFGSFPYQQGKLSTSTDNLGLPAGEKSPVSIYQTFPNIYRQGQALPQPYGPVDNLRMQSLYEIHGFGRRKSKKSKKTIKLRTKRRSKKTAKLRSKKTAKRRSKKSQRLFGDTPGTPSWKAESVSRNAMSRHLNKYANANHLSEAKGYTDPSIKLYMNNQSSKIPNLIGMPNVPGQFTNNQMNSPIFNFGKRKPKSCLKEPPKPRTTEKIKRRRFGPNVVGYEAPIPIYYGGGNTINFQSNKMYNPDIIPSVGKVQQDGMTKNAWLTQSVGIGDGLGNNFRFGKNTSNDLVYSPNDITGSGNNTIMQPLPDYLKKRNFGNKKLTTCFGGSVITLNPSGQIKISKPS